MPQVNFDQVTKSYNGKSGCMCGCNGTYKLPSSADLEAANKEVGYEAYDQSNVSDRSVKIAVNKVNKALEGCEGLSDEELELSGVGINAEHAWVDQGGRNTVVYF